MSSAKSRSLCLGLSVLMGLSPIQNKDITWTNVELSSIGYSGKNLIKIWKSNLYEL